MYLHSSEKSSQTIVSAASPSESESLATNDLGYLRVIRFAHEITHYVR
jgi:hypothetical protein